MAWMFMKLRRKGTATGSMILKAKATPEMKRKTAKGKRR